MSLANFGRRYPGKRAFLTGGASGLASARSAGARPKKIKLLILLFFLISTASLLAQDDPETSAADDPPPYGNTGAFRTQADLRTERRVEAFGLPIPGTYYGGLAFNISEHFSAGAALIRNNTGKESGLELSDSTYHFFESDYRQPFGYLFLRFFPGRDIPLYFSALAGRGGGASEERTVLGLPYYLDRRTIGVASAALRYTISERMYYAFGATLGLKYSFGGGLQSEADAVRTDGDASGSAFEGLFLGVEFGGLWKRRPRYDVYAEADARGLLPGFPALNPVDVLVFEAYQRRTHGPSLSEGLLFLYIGYGF